MLCLKQKLTTICQAQQFCAICLETSGKLWSIHTEFDIAVGNFNDKKLLIDLIEYIFNNEGQQILSSSYLCSHCIEKSIQAYLFIYNTKQLSKIIVECVKDLNLKTVDINNSLPSFDDNQTANVYILLEQEYEVSKYLNISKTTEIVAVETSETELKSFEEDKINFKSKKIETEAKSIIKVEETQLNYSEIIGEKANDANSQLKPLGTTSDDESNEDIETEYLEPDLQSSADEDGFNEDKDGTYLNIKSPSTERETDNENSQIKTELFKPQIMRKTKRVTYRCSNCKQMLPSRKGFLEHRKSCKNLMLHKFKCKVCSKSFVTQRSLNTHYKSHAKTSCKVCQFIVPDSDLQEHVRINHEEYAHFCKSCSFFSYTAEKLKTHTEKTHSGPQCALCFKKVKEKDLKLHKCRFNCLECTENICIHYKYLMSYREQVQNNVAKIKCVDCDYIGSNRESLLGHVNREHLDHHPFTCDHCKQQFFSRTALRYHINVFHMDKHVCEFCDQEFLSKTNLENHRKLCECVEKEHKCDNCKSSFDTIGELANHVKIKHNKEAFDCDLCKKKFLTNDRLHDHMFKIHNGVQIKRKRSLLICPICDEKCWSKTLLLEHIRTHGPNARLPCKECNKNFDGLRKLHTHMRKHDEDVIQCINCKKVFTKTFFPHHTVYCNAGREPKKRISTCEICGKTCYNDIQLRLHKRIHLDKVPCPICKKPTKPLYLTNHIKRLHSKPKKEKVAKPRYTRNYQCDLCEHRFSREAELENHTNRFHLKVKPYQCDYCQKRFCGKERLREHLITHTTAKNCYCTVCNKKFQNKSCLNQHMRKHTGVNPYTCEVCGESFRTSSIKNTHRIKKHSEKTVACPLCGGMFHLTKDMRTHFRKVHWRQKNKKFDPRDVKELRPEFYHLFEDRRIPKVDGEDLCISSKSNVKYV